MQYIASDMKLYFELSWTAVYIWRLLSGNRQRPVYCEMNADKDSAMLFPLNLSHCNRITEMESLISSANVVKILEE